VIVGANANTVIYNIHIRIRICKLQTSPLGIRLCIIFLLTRFVRLLFTIRILCYGSFKHILVF